MLRWVADDLRRFWREPLVVRIAVSVLGLTIGSLIGMWLFH